MQVPFDRSPGPTYQNQGWRVPQLPRDPRIYQLGGQSGVGALPMSRPSRVGVGADSGTSRGEEFISRVNKAGTSVVNMRRQLAQARESSVELEQLRQTYVDLRGRVLNALRLLHEANPKLPRESIRIPKEMMPPASWASWATFVETPEQIAQSGLGAFFIPLAIFLAVSALVARSLNVDDVMLSYARDLEVRSNLAERAGSSDPSVAGPALNALKQLPPPPKDPFGLDSLRKTLVTVAVVGGIGLGFYLLAWPRIAVWLSSRRASV